MIKLLENYGGEGLKDTHYSRMIRSHLSAYGAGYNFCLFYEIIERRRVGIISIFNGAVTVDLTEGAKPSREIRMEIKEFIDFQRPYSVELPAELVQKSGFDGYMSAERRFYEVPPGEDWDGLITPDYDAAFSAMGLGQDSYPLWLTDITKRVNSGLSELLGYKTSVLTVRFKQSGLAYITDLATPPEDRKKGHARELLLKTAAKLRADGAVTYLSARPSLWEFYEKVGCRTVGGDFIYIQKEK